MAQGTLEETLEAQFPKATLGGGIPNHTQVVASNERMFFPHSERGEQFKGEAPAPGFRDLSERLQREGNGRDGGGDPTAVGVGGPPEDSRRACDTPTRARPGAPVEGNLEPGVGGLWVRVAVVGANGDLLPRTEGA